jgi:hypothetical protein
VGFKAKVNKIGENGDKNFILVLYRFIIKFIRLSKQKLNYTQQYNR